MAMALNISEVWVQYTALYDTQTDSKKMTPKWFYTLRKMLSEELGFHPVTTSVSESEPMKNKFIAKNFPGMSVLPAHTWENCSSCLEQ